MSWAYTLQADKRMPPCPFCRSLSGTVRLKGTVYVCMDCLPRRAFEAHWIAQVEQSEQAS